VTLRLNTIVSRVEWRPGAVTAYARTVTGQRLPPFRARTLVLTVPLGVLKAAPAQAGAIAFVPPLSSKRRPLALLEAGHVCKVALRFRDRFWEEKRFLAERMPPRPAGVEGAPINFWHDGRLAFPTWWTAAPRHAPVLTAWAGGPRAESLLGRPEGELIGRSLVALAAVMRLSRATLEARLESWLTHDWRADPYSRGAYSYAAVGGESAAEALARPVEGTLFFAGEATEAEEGGTVQAALASGQRVARQMMRSRASGGNLRP
jgi:monoamine oxidase